MENANDPFAVCPKCHGKGTIESYRHVAAGVCFRCWGTGRDLVGEFKAVQSELFHARRKWRHLDRAAKAAEGKEKEALLSERDTLTREGKKLAKLVRRLEADQAQLRDRARQMAR